VTVGDNLDLRVRRWVTEIYGRVPPELASGLADLIASVAPPIDTPTDPSTRSLWDQRDCVLITYADQIQQPPAAPLRALHDFLRDYDLTDLTRIVHLLPFFPWTSDDGFSVVDYDAVDPAQGDWASIESFGKDVDLMFDLVLNHCSSKHRWFQQFLKQREPYRNFFIDLDPNVDTASVVRPRSTPLLTPFQTDAGVKHVWTTFSDDQIDLNYAEPRLLLEMMRTLVDYARRGARIIRLDAIAYLWKQTGTPCIHLPQTHAVVKLMRRILELTYPGTLVLTETNVPHAENISYFGDDDEAHIVYQFSLPPLILDAVHNADSQILTDWLENLAPPFPDTTFLNFTASHDGIGVRPLEGLVSAQRLHRLVDTVRQHGGVVSTRRTSDGGDSPYELNISYIDAVADARRVSPRDHATRFLGTQAIMLALRGLPAIYFHSLVGSGNDLSGMRQSGRNRSINRRKYAREELDRLLGDDPHHQDPRMRYVFQGYWQLLRIRQNLTAMHPGAPQRVLKFADPALFGLVRGGDNPNLAALTVVANFSDQPKQVRLATKNRGRYRDWIAGCLYPTVPMQSEFESDAEIPLAPFQVRWLVDRS
jgi:sucrose phosphorylase